MHYHMVLNVLKCSRITATLRFCFDHNVQQICSLT